MDDPIPTFVAAHITFLEVEQQYHAQQCSRARLDAAFHDLKRHAARAVAINPQLQVTLAAVTNRMREIQRGTTRAEPSVAATASASASASVEYPQAVSNPLFIQVTFIALLLLLGYWLVFHWQHLGIAIYGIGSVVFFLWSRRKVP